MKFIIFLTVALLLLPVALAFTATGGDYVVDKTSTGDATGEASGGTIVAESTSTAPEPVASASGGDFVATTSYFDAPVTAAAEEEDTPAPSGSSGGGSTTPTLRLEDGPIEITLSTLGTLNFMYDNNRHKMRISELETMNVAFHIESDPVFVRVAVGEEKQVDIDGDNAMDLIVSVLSVTQSSARIKLAAIGSESTNTTEVTEVIEEPEVVEEVVNTEPSPATGSVVENVTDSKAVDEAIDTYEINLFWVSVFVVLGVIIIASWIFWKKS